LDLEYKIGDILFIPKGQVGQVKIFNEEPYLSSTGAKISLNGDFKIDNSNIETVADTLNIQSNLTNQIRRFTRRVKKFKV